MEFSDKLRATAWKWAVGRNKQGEEVFIKELLLDGKRHFSAKEQER
jgi:hypothetical protein